MISIAITGGIGSGKTYVSDIFQNYGVPIYNADTEAKRLMTPMLQFEKGWLIC